MIPTPTTLRKRVRNPKVASATDGDDTPSASPTKKKCGTPCKANGDGGRKGKKALPTSYEAASEEYKIMLRMKDDENKTWPEIKKAWTQMTGAEGRQKHTLQPLPSNQNELCRYQLRRCKSHSF